MQAMSKTKVILPKEWNVEPTEDGGWLVTVQKSTKLLNNFKFKLYLNDDEIELTHGEVRVVVGKDSGKELWYHIQRLQVDVVQWLLRQLVEETYPDLVSLESIDSRLLWGYFYGEGERDDFGKVVGELIAMLRQEAFLLRSEPRNMVRKIFQIHAGEFCFYTFSEASIQWNSGGVDLIGVWSEKGEYLDRVRVAFSPVVVIEKSCSALSAPYALVHIVGTDLNFFEGRHFHGEWVDGVPISFVVTRSENNKDEKEGC